MEFFKYYKSELENAKELKAEKVEKILNFIYKNSSFSKKFCIDFLAFLDDCESVKCKEEYKLPKVKENLLCILADMAHIHENGTRTGGVYSFAYNQRAECLLYSFMANSELERLHDPHDCEKDIISKLGEAALYSENVERLKADILAENFADEIMQTQVGNFFNN